MDSCREKSMLPEACSPLGVGAIFQVPEMRELAAKSGRSIAQVCVRGSLRRDYLPLPKSVTLSRIQENLKVLDSALSDEDAQLTADLEGCVGYAQDSDQTRF